MSSSSIFLFSIFELSSTRTVRLLPEHCSSGDCRQVSCFLPRKRCHLLASVKHQKISLPLRQALPGYRLFVVPRRITSTKSDQKQAKGRARTRCNFPFAGC